MKKIMTVTIGIPAFNEEVNIVNLITSLLHQKLLNAEITKIYIVSDCSIDNTVEKANSIKDSRLIVWNNTKRMGKKYILNLLFKKVTDDLLVIIDADVIPSSDRFIQELINTAVTKKNVGLVGANIVSLKTANYFEKIIETSHRFKQAIYLRENNADNIYLCHGRSIGFTKSFYKNLRIPNDVPDDAYAYLSCKKMGYKFYFSQRAIVLFKSPSNFTDHVSQSVRFLFSKEMLSKYFSKEYINKNYKLTKLNICNTLAQFLITNPLEIGLFMLIVLYCSLFADKKNINQAIWSVAASSKNLNTV